MMIQGYTHSPLPPFYLRLELCHIRLSLNAYRDEIYYFIFYLFQPKVSALELKPTLYYIQVSKIIHFSTRKLWKYRYIFQVTIISYYFVIIFQCLPANFFRIYARNMSHIIYISANKKAPNENNYSVVVFPFGASQFSWLACRGYKYWSEQGFTQRFPSFYLAVDILLFNCQELALVQAARRCHPRYDVGSSLYLPPVIRILDILF